MLKAKTDFSKTKKNIIFFGILNCIVYIILFMAFKWLDLLHFSGLRMLNYVTFFILSLYQIRRWTKQAGGYIPSFQAFTAIFFTGALSFMLLAGFIFAYSLYDHYITELYFNTYGKLSSISSALIFFEGLAGSLIVALVAMMYSDRYKDGEASIS